MHRDGTRDADIARPCDNHGESILLVKQVISV
ncbi:hypothetical protein ZBT109_1624 [Zymobacter palmae]|uniref:Uncharacterized protein n=1 Tax=Zymobacter palmae TaxID=33074 RepID=A0A348HFH8_9GAMM|nr:hypothetical protein ZBT109_1624 [Zymobacter palmae]